MPHAVETTGLTHRYGSILAVDQVSMVVPKGCVYGFLGPNGAGKTTTLRLLLGLITLRDGTIHLLGEPLTAASRAALMRRVGALIEEPSVYRNLTGVENLEATRVLRGLPRAAVGRVLDRVGLSDADARRRVGGYSQGMRQRLGLALALLAEPALLILDEPANGLDPDGIQTLRDVLARLHQEGETTVLVSSHQLGEVERVATHIGVMRSGKLVRQGPMRDLLQHAEGSTHIRLSDPAAAATALASAGTTARVHEGRVMLETTSDAGIAAAIRVVVEAGLDVFAVDTEAPSLEAFFFASDADAGVTHTAEAS
ncbi:MAG: ATP-binding cassette domain-containing protein [Bacteroidota bacterium]